MTLNQPHRKPKPPTEALQSELAHLCPPGGAHHHAGKFGGSEEPEILPYPHPRHAHGLAFWLRQRSGTSKKASDLTHFLEAGDINPKDASQLASRLMFSRKPHTQGVPSEARATRDSRKNNGCGFVLRLGGRVFYDHTHMPAWLLDHFAARGGSSRSSRFLPR